MSRTGNEYDYCHYNICKETDKRKKDSILSIDPFYSESNREHLRRGVEALNAGKGVEHDIIEVDE